MPRPRKSTRKRPRSIRKSSAGRRAVGSIRGRGGYWADKVVPAYRKFARGADKIVPRGLLSVVGRGIGSVLGATSGLGPFGMIGAGALGAIGGKSISAITGFGAYNVKANSIMAGVSEGVQVPQFGGTKHATIISHREYVQDILVPATDTAFTNLQFPMNPGLSSSFPWLSTVADSFDQYQILGMVWEFRTLSSDITSGGALGSVILATDYDTADTTFQNKLQMENSEYCTSNKPSVDTVHCIECDPKLTFCPIKYVRSGPVPSGKDVRLYDHGLFQLATQGLPGVAATVIGELWCSYQIAFYKPNLQNVTNLLTDHFALPSTITSSHYLTAAASQPALFGSAGSSLGGSVVTSSYSFPVALQQGRFMVYYQATGAASTITTGCNITGVNTTSLNMLTGDTAAFAIAPQAGALACTTLSAVFTFNITASPASITIAAGTLPGTLAGGDLWVWLLPPGLTT